MKIAIPAKSGTYAPRPRGQRVLPTHQVACTFQAGPYRAPQELNAVVSMQGSVAAQITAQLSPRVVVVAVTSAPVALSQARVQQHKVLGIPLLVTARARSTEYHVPLLEVYKSNEEGI